MQLVCGCAKYQNYVRKQYFNGHLVQKPRPADISYQFQILCHLRHNFQVSVPSMIAQLPNQTERVTRRIHPR
jgi:hypothetical protein